MSHAVSVNSVQYGSDMRIKLSITYLSFTIINYLSDRVSMENQQLMYNICLDLNADSARLIKERFESKQVYDEDNKQSANGIIDLVVIDQGILSVASKRLCQ